MTQTQPSISVVRSVSALDPNYVLVAPYFEDDDAASTSKLAGFDQAALEAAVARGEVRSRKYEMALFHRTDQPSVLLIGAGRREEIDPVIAVRLAAAASRHLVGKGYRHIAYVHSGVIGAAVWAQAVVEGALRGPYDSGVKKSGDREARSPEAIALVSSADTSELGTGGRTGQITGQSINTARDLINLPPNELTPSSFAQRARDLAQEVGLRCEVFGEDVMRKLGMGSLLGVSAGSDEPAQLIVLSYGPSEAAIKLAVVGKGLTFDSGGLSLKTAEGMETMKGDMGGGAAVVAGMLALARLAPENISVTGYVGATENMPSGKSMRPGDVLTAMTGETIEVLNTDAEGRLVLADVLAYACRQGATHIVDFATLTGGAMVALGRDVTLATGKPESWVNAVVEAARDGLERAWPMPLYEEYRRAMDSDVADIKNTGGRYGSALTAAAFLSDFVEKVPWAHMDIAGTSWGDKTAFRASGGTGAGVGTIVALALALANGSSDQGKG